MPKWYSEAVNCRRTDNTMAKLNRTKGRTVVYKVVSPYIMYMLKCSASVY